MEESRTNKTNTMQTLNLSPQEFGDMLSNCRNECGMTQWRATTASGIEINTISKLERGDLSQIAKYEREYGHRVIQCLCKVYQSDPAPIIAAFDRELTIFLAKQYTPQEEDSKILQESVLASHKEERRISAYVIGALIGFILLLAIAGHFYEYWMAPDDDMVDIPDLTEFAPVPELPMPVQAIPRN